MPALKQILLMLGSLTCCFSIAEAADQSRPNIVYIMSDELAYYELGHMGNPYIRTPNIDKMAEEGIRFTQALAGSPVCAPLRCNLMTGKHAGHASVRANDGGTPLRKDEPTIASMLKKRGYATGGYGKWGCGGRDSTGVPETHGFDDFFGYYDQVHAHSFYPPYLVRNSEEVKLPGNIGGRSGQTYSHYEIINAGLDFIRSHKDQPFFAYFPITPPHGMYDIPKDDPAWKQYEHDEWMKDESIPQDVKNYAAMVTMVDNNLGTILDLLRELNLEKNTIVFFTGDNGGQDRFKSPEHPRGFFGPNVNPTNGVEFRGGKGNLYEGGLRIPFLVRWPGKIEAGKVSDKLFYQPDILPTLAELTGATPPDDIDGLSILPTLFGTESTCCKPVDHDYLYWEFGQQTAVRINHWKGIQPGTNKPWELYDLSKDVSESQNIADEHPELVARMKQYADEAHEPVQPGIYLDQNRTRHEADRRAKWGTSPNQPTPRVKGKVNQIQDKNLIPVEKMKLVSVSSENTGNRKNGFFAIDGDPRTLWHSQFSPKLIKHPHELIIDLGQSYEVTGFRYLARQDGGWNGAFAKTEFYISEDPKMFDQPSLTATFTKKKQAQPADLETPQRGRYVKIRILSEVNGGAWSSAAEIGVTGK